MCCRTLMTDCCMVPMKGKCNNKTPMVDCCNVLKRTPEGLGGGWRLNHYYPIKVITNRGTPLA